VGVGYGEWSPGYHSLGRFLLKTSVEKKMREVTGDTHGNLGSPVPTKNFPSFQINISLREARIWTMAKTVNVATHPIPSSIGRVLGSTLGREAPTAGRDAGAEAHSGGKDSEPIGSPIFGDSWDQNMSSVCE